ncbi:hypothetical protein DPMN_174174 [Dreissena polymorpha]|uniref:Uncharacterized protein n=1 Tax=Dreissena polymorpha TaxID=45954 RepID=A0A9D4E2Y4_DREPO|nr:hypothetical protein DPMN_174174 [Dreissena polymorpha]
MGSNSRPDLVNQRPEINRMCVQCQKSDPSKPPNNSELKTIHPLTSIPNGWNPLTFLASWRLHNTLIDGGKPSSSREYPVEECLRLRQGPLDKGC